MDVKKQRELLAQKSERLLNELELIYMSGAWRSHPPAVERERKIRKQLSEIYSQARKLPAY